MGCKIPQVYDQNFYLGGGGGIEVVDGVGANSERCLKWGVGGSLKNLSKNNLKEGVGKGRNYIRGEWDLEGVTTPAPHQNFNHTPAQLFMVNGAE